MSSRAENADPEPDQRTADRVMAGALPLVDPGVLLDALFLRSPLAMAVHDAGGRIVAVNEAFTRLTGVAAADILPSYSLLTDGELVRLGMLSEVRRAFAGETVTLPPMRRQPAAPTHAGGTMWMRTHLHPLHDGHGVVTHVLMTQIDLTVHQLSAGATSDAPTATGPPASRERSVLLAVMSHELRTPLNAIFGYTDLLDAGVGGSTLSNAQSAHLKRIRQAARQLGELIDTVLAFARLEAGDSDLASEDVDIVAVVRDSVETMGPTAEMRGLALELDTPGSVRLETDAAKLRQILISLLSNALKFTERGTVRVAVRDQAGAVFIDVADTGIGIGDADLSIVFEPFTQIDSSLTRRVDGAGLGLALAAGLARLLGGTITVDSRLGAGSTFTLRLPRASATTRHQSLRPAAPGPE